MNNEVIEIEKEAREDKLFTTLFLGVGGALFMSVGIIQGIINGASDGIVPMMFGAAFLLVMGVFKINSIGNKISVK